MGGLGPGIGGSELIVIGLVALLVVGPKDLPLMMRRVGQFVAKARGMANDFRASFDEMARQSELDDLRKEVEALRRGQGMHPLGDEAAAAFKDINQSLNAPMTSTPAPALSAPSTTPTSEWPDTTAEAVAAEVEPVAAPKPKRKAAPRRAAAKAEPAETAETRAPKPTTGKAAARRASNARAAADTAAAAAAKPPRAPRKRTPKS